MANLLVGHRPAPADYRKRTQYRCRVPPARSSSPYSGKRPKVIATPEAWAAMRISSKYLTLSKTAKVTRTPSPPSSANRPEKTIGASAFRWSAPSLTAQTQTNVPSPRHQRCALGRRQQAPVAFRHVAQVQRADADAEQVDDLQVHQLAHPTDLAVAAFA